MSLWLFGIDAVSVFVKKCDLGLRGPAVGLTLQGHSTMDSGNSRQLWLKNCVWKPRNIQGVTLETGLTEGEGIV